MSPLSRLGPSQTALLKQHWYDCVFEVLWFLSSAQPFVPFPTAWAHPFLTFSLLSLPLFPDNRYPSCS